MKPDRYEPWPGDRRQLSGLIQRRGSRMGFSTVGGFLFGSPFVVAGTCIILVGTKLLPVDPASVHAPYWVLTAFGLSFALAGCMVWGMAWKQFTANRQRIRAARQHPNEPALADYSWHPDGLEVSEWPAAGRALAMPMGFTIFLSMFNWWAFAAGGEWMVKGIVGLFDTIVLVMWWQTGRQLGRAIEFGRSRVVFTRFPYRLTEPVILRWQPGGGIAHINRGRFTLRCVEEYALGKGIAHEEIYSEAWVIDQPRRIPPKDAVELRYEPLIDARPTQLSAGKPVFWELEVRLDLPGLDFKQTYLVPIYSSKTIASIKPILLNR